MSHTIGDPAKGVIVVGSVTADVTAFSERLARPGETIHGTDFTLLLGGKGANQAIAAGLSGARSSFVGCVGSDLFREMIVDGLTAAGVDITHLRTVPGATGVAHIRVDATAQNNIVIVPLANSSLAAPQIDTAIAELADTSAVLLTQLEIPVEAALHAIRAGRSHGLTTVLDPAPAVPLPEDIYPMVDIVTPNESEAEVMTGIAVPDLDAAAQAGRWFVDRGVGTAIVTCAGAGSVVVTADGARVVAPFQVTPVDTTAAGDAFAGYLGAALAEGQDLADAMVLANAAGALTVTVRGASPSLPRRAAVEAFRDERASSISITDLEG